MSVVVPAIRLATARARKALRDEQAFIEACERALETRPKDMGELVERAKATVQQERRP